MKIRLASSPSDCLKALNIDAPLARSNSKSLLTANDKIVTKNAQAAKNHWILQMPKVDSLIPASNTITEAGIKILDTNKSAKATLTINALPRKFNWMKEIEWTKNSLIKNAFVRKVHSANLN